MAAVELEWIPETLYNTAISAVVDNYIRSRRDIRSLPENIQFDVYYKVRPTGSLGPRRRRRRPWAAPPSTSAARPAALEAGSPPRPAAVAASRYPATPASASRAVRPPPGGSCASAAPHLCGPGVGLRGMPRPARSHPVLLSLGYFPPCPL